MSEEEMLDFCHDCPDYDVCVIDPEEFEDECLRHRTSEESRVLARTEATGK